MDFRPLNEVELKRIEESVQKGSAKIAELGLWLANGESFTTWANPLPEISSHFKDARSALDQLCDAHRQAVESVKTQESKVQQQNNKRAEELRAEKVAVDARAEKLNESEEKLDEKLKELEEKLDEKLKELKEKKERQKQRGCGADDEGCGAED